MKINEYYRNAAKMNLNGSIVSLLPAILIAAANIKLFKNQEVMLLTIPFILYSIFGFQLYLYQIKQSIFISRNIVKTRENRRNDSLFETNELLVFFVKTFSPQVMCYFPNGNLAGRIRRYRRGKSLFEKIYAMYNSYDEVIGFFQVQGKQKTIIEVFDLDYSRLGCFEKKRMDFRKYQKELLDSSGRYIGTIESSSAFMDEKVLNRDNREVARLRRGWMPLEWSKLFPEPNTPVLSFTRGQSDKDKLLQMSILINEFFIER